MKKIEKKERNRLLITVASIVIILNVALLVAAVVNVSVLGIWSLAIATGAILSITLSVVAIKRNDPAWLLLDLILPN